MLSCVSDIIIIFNLHHQKSRQKMIKKIIFSNFDFLLFENLIFCYMEIYMAKTTIIMVKDKTKKILDVAKKIFGKKTMMKSFG